MKRFKGLKRIIFTTFLATFMMFTVGYAKTVTLDDVNMKESIEKNDTFTEVEQIIIRTISANELPEGVIPKEFQSEYEFENYLENTFNESNKDKIEKEPIIINTNPMLRATNGIVLVDSVTNGSATIDLSANYGTTGNNSTGTISYISPFTGLSGTGPGYSYTWVQANIGYTLSNSNKDAYIYANGTLTQYVLVQGLVKVADYRVAFGRTVWLAR